MSSLRLLSGWTFISVLHRGVLLYLFELQRVLYLVGSFYLSHIQVARLSLQLQVIFGCVELAV